MGSTIVGAALCLLLLTTFMFKHKDNHKPGVHGYAALSTDDKVPIV